jgi:hypothetical protein
MKRITALSVVAISAALAACGQKSESPIRTSSPVGGTTTPSVQATAPAAQPDRDTPPKETPSTHSGAPQPESTAAPTARDSPANRPTSDLTAAEESKAMPKPGQTDNHFTPSLDGALKGSQQSPGTTGTSPPSTGSAPTSDAATQTPK